MSEYTKGPWRILPEECDKPYIRIRGTALGGRYKVANVLTPVYDGVHESEAQETRANAKLIASAPDLLEAAISAVNKCIRLGSQYGTDGYSHNKALSELQAAIKKATDERI